MDGSRGRLLMTKLDRVCSVTITTYGITVGYEFHKDKYPYILDAAKNNSIYHGLNVDFSKHIVIDFSGVQLAEIIESKEARPRF